VGQNVRRSAAAASLEAEKEVEIVEQEREVKEYLRSKFGLLKDVYKHYSCSTAESFTIALNAFSDFISDSGLADDRACNLANLDMMFIGCNMIGWVKINE
jgi:hypothetical protein